MFSRMFRDMEEDPFFAGFNAHHRQMEAMMRDPFAGFFGGANNALMGPAQQGTNDRRLQQRQRNPRDEMLAPFGGGFRDPFGFDSMFSNMRNMMQNMESAAQNGNGHCYSQTSFMSYSNTGQGEPKMYQSSQSIQSGPGGVREVRKSVRDSESGLEKMSVGHHIRERGHVIEKARNRKTGEENDNEDLINIDDTEKARFDAEWREKTRQQRANFDYARRGHRSVRQGSGQQLALEDSQPKERRRDYRDRD